MTEIERKHGDGIFDSVKRVTPAGADYWLARELQEHLGYDTWESFENAIERAREACRGSNIDVSHQFRDVTIMMNIGKGGRREARDYALSRYACYLVAMNSQPTKAKVALAQSYFAVQTRRQELADAAVAGMTEDEQRLVVREKIRVSNTALKHTASSAGVTSFGFFGDAGYRGMYNASQSTVKKMKGIEPNEDFLDCIGPLELTANDFRIRLTEEKLRQGNAKGQTPAEAVHRNVGRKVRELVREEIGHPPEAIPRAAESIKQLERRKRKELKGK